jgi:hypothetical protein
MGTSSSGLRATRDVPLPARVTRIIHACSRTSATIRCQRPRSTMATLPTPRRRHPTHRQPLPLPRRLPTARRAPPQPDQWRHPAADRRPPRSHRRHQDHGCPVPRDPRVLPLGRPGTRLSLARRHAPARRRRSGCRPSSARALRLPRARSPHHGWASRRPPQHRVQWQQRRHSRLAPDLPPHRLRHRWR